MILKNSFWDRVKQNAKRRSWCYLINTIVLFLILPVAMLVSMSGLANSGVKDEMYREKLYNQATDILGMNMGLAFIVLILAIFVAIQGYSYLHSRKKTDMYHSQPVSNKVRYWSIYLNSVLSFLLPYSLCVLICMFIAGTYKVMDLSMAILSLLSFFLYVCFFLAVHAVVTTVVMLTGKLMTAILGSVSFLFYGALLSVVLDIYRQRYLYSYGSSMSRAFLLGMNMDEFMAECSVVGFILKMANEYKLERCAGLFAETIFTTLLFTVLSYILYTKRKAESAGTSMAFPKTKSVFELVVGIPVALLGGYLISMAAGNIGIFCFAGPVLGMLIVHIVFQLVYEADISKILKKWKVLVAGIAGTLAFIFILYFDLPGYDSYVPKASQIESAAYCINYNSYIDLSNDTERMDGNINGMDYMAERMYYTDVDNIIALAKENIFVKENDGLFSHQKIGNLLERQIYDSSEEYNHYMPVEVLYRLKNGHQIQRKLYIDTVQAEDSLKRLVESREYKAAHFQISDERILTNHYGEPFPMEVSDRFETYSIDSSLAAGLREAYLKDLENYNYETAMQEFPVAQLLIYQNEGHDWPVYSCEIYPEYTETLKYLAENKIYEPVNIENLNLKEVTIISYNKETFEEEKRLVYTDESEVSQIRSLLDVGMPYNEYRSRYDNTIEVLVGDDMVFYMKEGAELPDFVKEGLEK